MFRKLAPSGLLLVGVLLLCPGEASAGRVPTVRNSGMRDPGVRGDKAVPYLTTGNQAFFSTTVAPIVLTSARADDPKYPPVAGPTYNLPVYGLIQGIGDRFDGATPRLGSDANYSLPWKTRVKIYLPTIYPR